jgi:L-xylulokinase
MVKYLMGIDNGSTMIKVGVFSLSGEEIAVGTAKCGMTSPVSGWYERDMDGIWEANVKAIRDAVSKAGADASDIVAVSLTGHGNGAHFVDERGGGVRNSVESLDSRGQPYADRWAADGTFKKIHPHMPCFWDMAEKRLFDERNLVNLGVKYNFNHTTRPLTRSYPFCYRLFRPI